MPNCTDGARWDVLSETSPSGKTLFRCRDCERVSQTPDKRCAPPLLPCPFCGGSAIPERTLRDGCTADSPDAYAHTVRCRSCAAEGGWVKTATGAARLWNMRTPSEKEATK